MKDRGSLRKGKIVNGPHLDEFAHSRNWGVRAQVGIEASATVGPLGRLAIADALLKLVKNSIRERSQVKLLILPMGQLRAYFSINGMARQTRQS